MTHSILSLDACPADRIDYSEFRFFSRYRRHPGFTLAEIGRISRLQLESVIREGAAATVCLENTGRVEALCALEPCAWESGHFGLPMARLHAVATETCALENLAGLIERTLSSGSALSGFRHVSVEVDIDDYLLINALIRNGFEMMDIKRTYFGNTIAPNPAYTKMLGHVRDYCEADLPHVREIIDAASFETRFTRDPSLDRRRADELYRLWFLNLLKAAGTSAHVVVFERMGRIVGCGGIGEMSFSPFGIDRRMRTGSLYACGPEGVGGYAPVLYLLTRDAMASHGLVETTISLNNHAAARVVEGFRPNRTISTYSMRRLI